MKQSKLVSIALISASLFSSSVDASISFKDKVVNKGPHDWSGLYVGLNAGAVNHTMNMTDNNATTFLGTIQQVSNPKVTGGFQAGYRQQLDQQNFSGVYGVELSVNYSDAKFKKQYGSPFALYQLNSQHELNVLCLLELMGGLAIDRVLLFLSAGLSWVDISGNTTNTSSIPFFNSFSVERNALGTALGAGIEYAYNDKVSIRFKADLATPNTYTTSDNVGDTFLIANSIVQGSVGVNYKFG